MYNHETSKETFIKDMKSMLNVSKQDIETSKEKMANHILDLVDKFDESCKDKADLNRSGSVSGASYDGTSSNNASFESINNDSF